MICRVVHNLPFANSNDVDKEKTIKKTIAKSSLEFLL